MDLLVHPKFTKHAVAMLQRLDSDIEYQVTEFVQNLQELESLPNFSCFRGIADGISEMWEIARSVAPESAWGHALRADLMDNMSKTAQIVRHQYICVYSAREINLYQ